MSIVEMKNEVTVNSLLMKSLESASREYARMCVKRLAMEYGFETEEALRMLNLENLKLQVQEMKKRSVGKAKSKVKVDKQVEKEKVSKMLFPLPFSKSNVSETGCQGLAYNGGLFTQCQKKCMADVRYCKGCQSEIDKTGGTTNGTVSQRLECELMEFKDPKGRKPVAYSKIMEKQKISREQVETEAGKLNMLIDEIHFVAGEKKTKKKAKMEGVIEDDLIAQLADELEESLADEVDIAAEKQRDENAKKEAELAKKADEKALMEQKKEAELLKKADEKAAKEKKIADEKAAKEKKIADEKAAKEKKIADEKAAKEQKLAEEKAAKEQKLAEEKAAKEAAIAQKKQQQADEKAAKEAEVALKKQQKEAEVALKKQQKEAEKEPKKTQKKQQKQQKESEKEVVEQKKEAEVAETPAPATKVTVKRITIDGKQYLKTAENLLYNPETKEEMGIYDPETNTIKKLPNDSEDELSEDEISDNEE